MAVLIDEGYLDISSEVFVDSEFTSSAVISIFTLLWCGVNFRIEMIITIAKVVITWKSCQYCQSTWYSTIYLNTVWSHRNSTTLTKDESKVRVYQKYTRTCVLCNLFKGHPTFQQYWVSKRLENDWRPRHSWYTYDVYSGRILQSPPQLALTPIGRIFGRQTYL